MEERKSALRILTCKSTGKRPLGKSSHRCEDKVRMDLKEMGVCTRNWVVAAQDRDYWRVIVNSAFNLEVP